MNLIIIIGVAFVFVTIAHHLADDEDTHARGLAVSIVGARAPEEKVANATNVITILLGVVLGLLVNYIRTGETMLQFGIYVLLVLLMMYQWYKAGTERSEFLWFTALTVVVGFAGATVASRVGVSALIPAIMTIVAIGFYAYYGMKFWRDRYDLSPEEEAYFQRSGADDVIASAEDASDKFRRYMSLVLIATVVAISAAMYALYTLGNSFGMEEALALSGFNISDWSDWFGGQESEDEESEAEDEDIVENDSDVIFYNDKVQNDGISGNEFNYGPKPSKGKSPEYYFDEFRSTLGEDPAFLSATAVSLDAMVGTDYIGQILHEGYDESLNVLERADAATLVMVKDQNVFNKAAVAVDSFLNKAVIKVKVKEAKVAYDQLYMNPATVTGVPGLVCYETKATKSKYLVLTCRVKNGETVDIWYHIPCRYQWSIPDAEETINVTPQKVVPSRPSKASKTSSPGRGDGPSKPSKPSKVTKPKKVKDKSQGMKNPGKGTSDKNTNNPADPNHSTADTKNSSSNSGKTPSQFQEGSKNNETAKQEQKRGNDSTPSTNGGGKSDNNGQSDSGHSDKSSSSESGQKHKGHTDAPAD